MIRSMKSLIMLGILLLGAAWGGYIQWGYPIFEQKMIATQRSILLACQQLEEMDHQIEKMEQLRSDIRSAELELGGMESELPNSPREVDVLAKLMDELKDKALMNVRIAPLGESEIIQETGETQGYRTHSFEIVFESSYEESKAVIKKFQKLKQLVTIDSLVMEHIVLPDQTKQLVETKMVIVFYYNLQKEEKQEQLQIGG